MHSKMRLALVSCVKSKREAVVPAKDLYVSEWFRKARSLVERSGLNWFILSAEHGLLDPEERIGPYERTLKTMRATEKRAWAEKVIAQMDERLPAADEIVVLAGQDYRMHLMPYLRRRYASVAVPMERLSIGRQLNWLDCAKAH